MKENTPQISCPGCGHNIDVNTLIYAQVADQIKKDISKNAADDRKIFEETIRRQFFEEKENELENFRNELRQKSEQVKDLNKTKADLERLTREKDELRSSIEAETEIKISETLKLEKDRIFREVDEKNNLKLFEKEHLIESLKNQIQILTRKAEQGSMQIQGEVQELAIEEYLQTSFPLDQIIEIRKGVRGADCVQVVNSREKANCGSILYESKRTQAWAASWVPKFKSDMLLKNAQFGVIITEVYPPGIESMVLYEGV